VRDNDKKFIGRMLSKSRCFFSRKRDFQLKMDGSQVARRRSLACLLETIARSSKQVARVPALTPSFGIPNGAIKL